MTLTLLERANIACVCVYGAFTVYQTLELGERLMLRRAVTLDRIASFRLYVWSFSVWLMITTLYWVVRISHG